MRLITPVLSWAALVALYAVPSTSGTSMPIRPEAFSSEANEIFDDDYDDYVIDESNHFDLLDLVDSLPNINVTDADVTNIDEEDELAPGNPLDPEDFRLAMSEPFDDPILDEVHIDPIEHAGAFEGDILNVKLHDLERMASPMSGDDGNMMRNAIKESYRKWPGGVVPYEISHSYNSRERGVIARAMQQYHKKTCIKFIPRTYEKGYIRIVKGSGCSSSVGRTGRSQVVSLGNGCVYPGIVIHELMHAIGFWHEQSRADRDGYVTIHKGNIMRGMEYNFMKYSLAKINHLGAKYDTCSVMHYGAYAFSRNRRPTISVKPAGKLKGDCKLGQRNGFSDTDLYKINKLYQCKGTTGGGSGGGGTTTGGGEETSGPCKDGHKHCATWASMGECQKNPSWMLMNCKISCGECDNKCTDHNSFCPEWANLGECKKNPQYMNLYCKKSCKKCQSEPCKDEKDDCPYWANTKKYCKSSSYKNFMELRCKKSCKLCTP